MTVTVEPISDDTKSPSLVVPSLPLVSFHDNSQYACLECRYCLITRNPSSFHPQNHLSLK